MSEIAIVGINNSETNFERMASLGLNSEVLTQSIWMGLSKYRSASKLEPLNAGGSKASFAIIETLREQLLGNGLGWKMLNQNGQCLTTNSEKQVSVLVTSGDKYTGLIEGVDPCTRNGKGAETKNQVKKNLGQTLCLFEEGIITDREKLPNEIVEPIDRNELWVLLYHFDLTNKEVRFELSLPIGIKEVGNKGKVKVSEWADRLRFSSLPFDENNITNESPEFNDDIEFNIKPKE